jgi:hypothetical protein
VAHFREDDPRAGTRRGIDPDSAHSRRGDDHASMDRDRGAVAGGLDGDAEAVLPRERHGGHNVVFVRCQHGDGRPFDRRSGSTPRDPGRIRDRRAPADGGIQATVRANSLE